MGARINTMYIQYVKTWNPTFQLPDCAGSKQPSRSRVFYQIFGLGEKDFRILIKGLEKDRISEFTREDFIE